MSGPEFDCYGGMTCTHREQITPQGITGPCVCEQERSAANNQIAEVLRGLVLDHKPTERVWVSRLERIIDRADHHG